MESQREPELPVLGSHDENTNIARNQHGWDEPLTAAHDVPRGDAVIDGGEEQLAASDHAQRSSQRTSKPVDSEHRLADEELIDIDTVAAMMSCSTRSIWRLSDAGKMPAPVRLGRMVRWSRRKLIKWIEESCPSARTMKYRK